VGKVERYHTPLRKAFEILYAELGTISSKEAILQMAVKAVNDTAVPNGLVPTLLVFGAFPRVTLDSPPTPSTLKRAEAITKAMKALRKLRAERQVRAALATRNGPNADDVLTAPLQTKMLVWREKDGWQGPFSLVSVSNNDVVLDLPNGPTKFRSTSVKRYYCDEIPEAPITEEVTKETIVVKPAQTTTVPKRRGRPRGAKSRATAFLTKKEEDNYALSLNQGTPRFLGRVTLRKNCTQSRQYWFWQHVPMKPRKLCE
jgi:hypothetical protein